MDNYDYTSGDSVHNDKHVFVCQEKHEWGPEG